MECRQARGPEALQSLWNRTAPIRDPQLVIVLSLPRSGSSFVTRALHQSGLDLFVGPEAPGIGSSPFNLEGYFEDTWVTLLNDQLIRMTCGMNANLLHLPRMTEVNRPDSAVISSYIYDLDESTVVHPRNYTQDVEHYTGTNWDVWGISRMVPGQKWYRAYSRAGLATGHEVMQGVQRLAELASAVDHPTVLKDPRLSLTLWQLDLPCRIVVIERELAAVLDSMRRHYGQRMFTTQPFEGHSWVSNHFNYQVLPQSFEEYVEEYQSLLHRSIGDREHVFVRLEDIAAGNTEALSNFMGRRIRLDADGEY